MVDRDTPNGSLLWVNEAARDHGILPGMRYAAGLSLARELRADVIDGPEIAREIDIVATLLRFATPDVEPSRREPGAFWLGADGLSLLHQSLDEWALLVHGELTRAGYLARVAVGFSRFGTYAAARIGPPGVLTFADPAQEVAAVRGVPLDRLHLPAQVRDLLARLAILTVGGLCDLPPEEIQRRFPREVIDFHRLARGERTPRLQPERVEEPLARRIVLDHAETDAARLLVGVEDLLGPLLARAAARGRSIAALTLTLLFEETRGVSANATANVSAARHERLAPAEPTRDLALLCGLVRLRIESLSLQAGVIEIGLEAEAIDSSVEQLELLAERRARDPAAAHRTLAALRAELGDHAVECVVLRDAHLPEARFEWRPMVRFETPTPRRVLLPPLVRRIFARPRAVATRSRHEPDGWLIAGLADGPVEETIGPYILAGGWWRRSVHREYHFVRTARGRWLWIFYDRERKRWMQQGEVE